MTQDTPTPATADQRGREHQAASDRSLHAVLRAAGSRYTRQRAAVYQVLVAAHNHPTADDVYQAVRRELPHISLATVYKALDALVAARLATKITSGDGSARYDCRGEDHYHLRDVQTGQLHDLPAQFDPDLLRKLHPELLEQLARQGIEVTGYRLEVLGRFRSPPDQR